MLAEHNSSVSDPASRERLLEKHSKASPLLCSLINKTKLLKPPSLSINIRGTRENVLLKAGCHREGKSITLSVRHLSDKPSRLEQRPVMMKELLSKKMTYISTEDLHDPTHLQHTSTGCSSYYLSCLCSPPSSDFLLSPGSLYWTPSAVKMKVRWWFFLYACCRRYFQKF